MSAWGADSFENDDAMDWVAALGTYSDDDLIVDALNTIIDQADDCPEETDCSVAITAAEVIAAQSDEPHDDCPDEIEAWVEGRLAPSATKIVQDRQAIQVILADSELKGLWQDSGSLEIWQASVEDLLSRLS